jgi:uncharacterized membrane protein
VTAAPPRTARIPAIDALRGGALVAMVVYHLAWNLSFLGLVETDVAVHPVWAGFARAIAGSFLLLAGVSLTLAARAGATPRRVLRRIAVIAAAAAVVSVATYAALPGEGVYFGILHCIAVSILLGWALIRLPGLALLGLAAAVFAAPWWPMGEAFAAPWWAWLGLTPLPPPAPDFVPLLPWFSAVLVGLAIGRHVPEAWAAVPLRGWPQRLLAAMGRRSLAVYLLHQPVLLALLLAVMPLLGRAPPAQDWRATFEVECLVADGTEAACRAYARCMVERLSAGDPPLLAEGRKALDEAEERRWHETAEACRAATR